MKEKKPMKQLSLGLVLFAAIVNSALGQTELIPQPTNLRGLVFITSADELKSDGYPATNGVVAPFFPLLRKPQFKKLIQPYWGKPMQDDLMRKLQRDIVKYYRKNGRPIVDVVYLEQDISNGVIQVVVLEGKVGQKRFTYSKYQTFGVQQWAPKSSGWASTNVLDKAITEKTGDTIIEKDIRKDLDWLARNPQREVGILFQRSTNGVVGQSDLVFEVREQREFSVSLGYEDTGTRVTDLNRVTAGVRWAKAFGLNDNIFNYQFIGDPSFDKLRAHVGDYWLPLPWRHALHFFGYYLDASGDLGNGVKLSGPSYQTSIRYEIPLPYLGNVRQDVSFGLDFKSSKNTLAFNGVTASDTPTEAFQLAVGYGGAAKDSWGDTGFAIQGYYSPGGITSDNTDQYFNGARLYAKANYYYGRIQLNRRTDLFSVWSARRPEDYVNWVITATGQWADENLIASEQLGIGGYSTVRGYDERQVNSDRGYIISNELRSPAFHPLYNWFHWGWGSDQCVVLAFYDYGVGQNVHLLPGEASQQTLSSVGGGIRYQLRKNLDARFDYGWQLNRISSSPISSRGHVSVVLHY